MGRTPGKRFKRSDMRAFLLMHEGSSRATRFNEYLDFQFQFSDALKELSREFAIPRPFYRGAEIFGEDSSGEVRC